VSTNIGEMQVAKILEVGKGRLTPEEAERWAKDHGLESFARKPLVSAAEAMALEKWTAPMAAAWFIWRSPDAVRDQWSNARRGWKIWERERPRGVPHNIVRWRLKHIGPATLSEVFCHAGFEEQIVRSLPSLSYS
jgi:hypothetical protein